MYKTDFRIFSGSSNPKLAERITRNLKTDLGEVELHRFCDGEIWVKYKENIRGLDVFVIQSTIPPAENLMELLIMIDAAKRASASRITAVIPYFGYARQDRKAKARDPISAKLIANLLTVAGADRILTMDLHAPQLQGFFDIPVDHLLGVPILAEYFKEKFDDYSEFVVVSPDMGSVTRSRKFAQRLNIPLAIIDKRRPKANECEIMNIIGNVESKRVILVDDLIDTGGTITNAAKALREIGATEVYACCTHAVLSGPAIKRIEESGMNELITLNTIALPKEKRIPQIKVLSVASVFAEAIQHNVHHESINDLFVFGEE